MKSRKIFLILIICLLTVTAAGVSLAVYVGKTNNDFEKNVTVDGDGVTTDTLEIKGLGLYPGGSRTYTVNIKGTSGAYTVALAFRDKDSAALKAYIAVSITAGNETGTYRLADLLNGEPVMRACTLGGEGDRLTIEYAMDATAGNETQGATADFDVEISIRRTDA